MLKEKHFLKHEPTSTLPPCSSSLYNRHSHTNHTNSKERKLETLSKIEKAKGEENLYISLS